MKWNSSLDQLRRLLTDLFPTEQDARQVVERAGIPTGRIEFSSAADTNWHNILREAHLRRKVGDLVSAASDDYPELQDKLTQAEKRYLRELKGEQRAPGRSLRSWPRWYWLAGALVLIPLLVVAGWGVAELLSPGRLTPSGATDPVSSEAAATQPVAESPPLSPAPTVITDVSVFRAGQTAGPTDTLAPALTRTPTPSSTSTQTSIPTPTPTITPVPLSIVSFVLDSEQSIFEEATSGDQRYFEIPDRTRMILNDLVLSQQKGEPPMLALSEMGYAIDYLFFQYHGSSIPIQSSALVKIFQDRDQPALLELITPRDPKAPEYGELNEARIELFEIAGQILTKEAMEQGDGFVREYVKPFRPLLLGCLEPVMNLTVYNGGARTAVITEVEVEVTTTLPKAAHTPSGPVPVVGIVDVTVPQEPGTHTLKLTSSIQINPDSSIVIPVRLNRETESLQFYELRIIVRGAGVAAFTEYFGLEM